VLLFLATFFIVPFNTQLASGKAARLIAASVLLHWCVANIPPSYPQHMMKCQCCNWWLVTQTYHCVEFFKVDKTKN